MNMPADFRAAFVEARRLQGEGQLLEAERILRSLAGPGEFRDGVLEALADLFLHQQRFDECLAALQDLTEEKPDNLHYCTKKANFLASTGRLQDAIAEYERLLQRKPDEAIAHFNVARLYAKAREFDKAIAAYEAAIGLNIDRVEEVWSNLGLVYSDFENPDKAREMFERAIEINPEYVPAMHNLAGLHEELSERDLAIQWYERIRELDPEHWDALARLVYPRKVTADDMELVRELESAASRADIDPVAAERLYFSLGKANDDLGDYDNAAKAYKAANALGKKRIVPYSRARTEAAFDLLIELFDREWIETMRQQNDAAPIFVCGMCRSGSTLLENMLGAHPRVTAGGEFTILPRLAGVDLAPYPKGIHDASREKLAEVGQQYLREVREIYPDHDLITDKRPDNFLNIGLIKVLFPAAKIIHTRRQPLDNALSLYFQQMGETFGYATDVEDSVHYYLQQERLVAHWDSILPGEIFHVDYETLVQDPEPALRPLLTFLGLEWDPVVLDFHKRRNSVKTASLWQVREKLHTRSAGRWRNYENLIEGARKLLQNRNDQSENAT